MCVCVCVFLFQRFFNYDISLPILQLFSLFPNLIPSLLSYLSRVTVIKWWRSDKKCGKKDLFDISLGDVLVVSAPDPGATEIMLKTECKVEKKYTVYTGRTGDDDDEGGEGWYTKTGRKRKQKKVLEEKRPYKRKKVVVDHPQGDGERTGVDPASSPSENKQRGPRTTKVGRPRSLPIDGDNDSSVPPNAVLSVSGKDYAYTHTCAR